MNWSWETERDHFRDGNLYASAQWSLIEMKWRWDTERGPLFRYVHYACILCSLMELKLRCRIRTCLTTRLQWMYAPNVPTCIYISPLKKQFHVVCAFILLTCTNGDNTCLRTGNSNDNWSNHRVTPHSPSEQWARWYVHLWPRPSVSPGVDWPPKQVQPAHTMLWHLLHSHPPSKPTCLGIHSTSAMFTNI